LGAVRREGLKSGAKLSGNNLLSELDTIKTLTRKERKEGEKRKGINFTQTRRPKVKLKGGKTV